MQRRNASIPSTAAAVIAVTLAMPLATAPVAAQTAAPTAAEAAFKRADANNDGKLSKEEAVRLPAIAAKFDELDKDKDGFLTMAEFSSGYAAPK